MLLGSNLGMLLSRRILTRDSDTALRDVVMYPVCNIGMLAGMVVMEMLVPATWFTTDPRTGGYGHAADDAVGHGVWVCCSAGG